MLLGAGAVAMALMPAPVHPDTARDGQPPGAALLPHPAIVEKEPDLTAAVGSLSSRVEKHLPAAAEVAKIEAPPPVEAAKTAPDPVADTGIKYCGSIFGPRSSGALLSSGDTKMIVPEGESFQGAKVVKVLPDKVVIEDSAGQREVTLEVRAATLFPEAGPARPATGMSTLEIPSNAPPDEQRRIADFNAKARQMNSEGAHELQRPMPVFNGAPTPARPVPRPNLPKNEKIGKDVR